MNYRDVPRWHNRLHGRRRYPLDTIVHWLHFWKLAVHRSHPAEVVLCKNLTAVSLHDTRWRRSFLRTPSHRPPHRGNRFCSRWDWQREFVPVAVWRLYFRCLQKKLFLVLLYRSCHIHSNLTKVFQRKTTKDCFSDLNPKLNAQMRGKLLGSKLPSQKICHHSSEVNYYRGRINRDIIVVAYQRSFPSRWRMHRSYRRRYCQRFLASK